MKIRKDSSISVLIMILSISITITARKILIDYDKNLLRNHQTAPTDNKVTTPDVIKIDQNPSANNEEISIDNSNNISEHTGNITPAHYSEGKDEFENFNKIKERVKGTDDILGLDQKENPLLKDYLVKESHEYKEDLRQKKKKLHEDDETSMNNDNGKKGEADFKSRMKVDKRVSLINKEPPKVDYDKDNNKLDKNMQDQIFKKKQKLNKMNEVEKISFSEKEAIEAQDLVSEDMTVQPELETPIIDKDSDELILVDSKNKSTEKIVEKLKIEDDMDGPYKLSEDEELIHLEKTHPELQGSIKEFEAQEIHFEKAKEDDEYDTLAEMEKDIKNSKKIQKDLNGEYDVNKVEDSMINKEISEDMKEKWANLWEVSVVLLSGLYLVF